MGFGSEASDLGPLIMCHEVMDVYLLTVDVCSTQRGRRGQDFLMKKSARVSSSCLFSIFLCMGWRCKMPVFRCGLDSIVS